MTLRQFINELIWLMCWGQVFVCLVTAIVLLGNLSSWVPIIYLVLMIDGMVVAWSHESDWFPKRTTGLRPGWRYV